MPEYNIIKININDIESYILDAKKESLVFCEKTELFGLYINNELKGFTGILFNKNKAIFKNHYIPKKFRGNGYFKLLFNFSIEICKALKIKTIEATCTKMSINYYLKNNFKIIKEYKNYKKVRNENIQ